ncbi:MAG: selenide, water dikinase SelD [Bacteroidetes bacterium GWF2_41_9]|nr:MAG: selenide, water dikinase SelD [Bacteroidetes bacterium GWA2_40_15]OFX90999.1 MAG: selenide, water dikinase SelD [Bacteroidetes bacterium GWC2_40_22]OFY61953.1 MAG: selenide, water dikinase SelD [Bacteroidetes bacterium GWF2_41_9]HAM09572.1 selenide, water dikinase SelD [Bacteroidales bacterium]HBH85561.1 selenide, water dikinase SelD [Bacteroidales bacterium]
MSVDLLKLVEYGGCSAKIPAKQLEEILKFLPLPFDPDILVDIDTHDDAGVYRINDELALVLTTDFFPPVCGDPYEFGQIAAANSISDVYAMGGDPVLALNIMMFPAKDLPMEAYAEILKGGFDKAAEAGVRIIGGHTIDDSPPKYGLAVVGFIHPYKIITNAGAKPGDKLILTKPVGTGVIMTAQRMGIADQADIEEAKRQMKLLNRTGAEVMKKHGIRGATDITGFGLAGHALKMARASKVSMNINMKNVPLIGKAYNLVDDGCIPGASFRNMEYAENDTSFAAELDYNLKMIAFDAQTSGGLLMSVPPEKANSVIVDLHLAGLTSSAIIGKVSGKQDKYIHL